VGEITFWVGTTAKISKNSVWVWGKKPILKNDDLGGGKKVNSEKFVISVGQGSFVGGKNCLVDACLKT